MLFSNLLFPACHSLSLDIISKKEAKEIDRHIRTFARETLNLPQNGTVHYLYTARENAGVGLPEVVKGTDVAAIDAAFKLLTAKDSLVRREAANDLKQVVCQKLNIQQATTTNVANYLNSSTQIRHVGNRGVWSRARVATKIL